MENEKASDRHKPSLVAPRLSCDCHFHILGPEDRFPYVADRSYTPPDALCGDYRQMADALGIERMVIVQASVYGADNRCTVAAIDEFGVDRARGVAMVPASISLAELRRLHEAGIRAARFIATARGGPSVSELPGVAKAVAEVGWHIEMYLPTQVLEELLPVIAELPVPVVFDHMGGLPADTPADDAKLVAILDLLERERAWVKLVGYRNSLAGYPYADVAPLARRFIERAPGRCVWGSDWPHTNLPGKLATDAELLDLLGSWVPDAETRKRILVDNPAVLYGF